MNLNATEIYPVKIWHGNVLDDESEFTQDDIINLQDVIENLSPDTHGNLQKPQSPPAHTDTGLFLQPVRTIEKIKDIFHDAVISLHEHTYPQFKGKLKVYDSVARGFVLNHNTTINDTMSNHPWSYTAVLVCRTPENLEPGQGDLVFIDPLPTSDRNDKHGISSNKLGTIAVFPGWLKYRLSPISKEQGTYDTVMLLVMNAMVVHTQNEEALKEEIKQYQVESAIPREEMLISEEGDVHQLGAISDTPSEVDISEIQDVTDTDIGVYAPRNPGEVDVDKF